MTSSTNEFSASSAHHSRTSQCDTRLLLHLLRRWLLSLHRKLQKLVGIPYVIVNTLSNCSRTLSLSLSLNVLLALSPAFCELVRKIVSFFSLDVFFLVFSNEVRINIVVVNPEAGISTLHIYVNISTGIHNPAQFVARNTHATVIRFTSFRQQVGMSHVTFIRPYSL